MAATKKPAKRMSAKQMKKTKGGAAIPTPNIDMNATMGKLPTKVPTRRTALE